MSRIDMMTKEEPVWLSELLTVDVPIKKKYQILLQSLEILKRVETCLSYAEMLQEIVPILEKNIVTFEAQGAFLEAELLEYV